ncbi:MAG: ribbon-helix-helix domain-containing protein [Euryarchaeota archaeon]|nr:ribbon-helix-helix domain-containing protein [Euryarchaeota archaeon]MEA2052661.1 ribbon-helix-helix domain-containing protein [Euryarchaeota archaeon]
MRWKKEEERKEHVTVWIDRKNLDYLDTLIDRGVFENRSQAIRHAIRTFVNIDKGLIRYIDSASSPAE